jgi:DNA-binding transcriptional LysR family regulator
MAVMDTEAMRWFQLVADGLTVTDVAAIHSVSQPHVSRALARLEAEVGTALLRRSGRVLRLTHAGTAFKAHVDRVVHELDDALAAVDAVVDPERGVVTLAYPLSLGVWLVPQLLHDFGIEHPRVRVILARTVVGVEGDASGLLRSRQADLEITTHPVAGDGVEWRRIGQEPLLAGVPLSHPLVDAPEISLIELAEEKWIVRRAPSGMRTQVMDLCAAVGFEPEIMHEVDDLPTVRGLIGAGLGVGVLPAMGLSAPVTFGGVRLIPLQERGAHRDLGLAWLSEGGRLPSAEMLRRFVLGRARSGRASDLTTRPDSR